VSDPINPIDLIRELTDALEAVYNLPYEDRRYVRTARAYLERVRVVVVPDAAIGHAMGRGTPFIATDREYGFTFFQGERINRLLAEAGVPVPEPMQLVPCTVHVLVEMGGGG
jgi:hypothetical protein